MTACPVAVRYRALEKHGKTNNTHKLIAKMIRCEVYRAVRASSNLFHDDILIDPMVRPSIGLVASELDASI